MTSNTEVHSASSPSITSKAPQTSPHTYDRNHPDQQEVSSILSEFNKDPIHLSIISLGKDGVLRNLTADREVLDAVGLSPRLVKASLDCVPPEYRALAPELEEVDGSNVSVQQLWRPDRSLLPEPMDKQMKERALARLKQDLEAQDEKKTSEEYLTKSTTQTET